MPWRSSSCRCFRASRATARVRIIQAGNTWTERLFQQPAERHAGAEPVRRAVFLSRQQPAACRRDPAAAARQPQPPRRLQCRARRGEDGRRTDEAVHAAAGGPARGRPQQDEPRRRDGRRAFVEGDVARELDVAAQLGPLTDGGLGRPSRSASSTGPGGRRAPSRARRRAARRRPHSVSSGGPSLGCQPRDGFLLRSVGLGQIRFGLRQPVRSPRIRLGSSLRDVRRANTRALLLSCHDRALPELRTVATESSGTHTALVVRA